MKMPTESIVHAGRALSRQGLAKLFLACLVGIVTFASSAQVTLSPAWGGVTDALLTGRPQVDDGQSATRLADGTWLLLGGVRHPARMSLRDASGGNDRTLDLRLGHPRSGHTATLLPDGSVLIVGGVSANLGSMVAVVERYDPVNQSLISARRSDLQPRANHTATVLLDGRVLLVGGDDLSGAPILQSELYDPSSGEVEHVTSRLDRGRLSHVAAHLLRDEVVFWSGTDGRGSPLVAGSVYDALNQTFVAISREELERTLGELEGAGAPRVVKSIPAAGDRGASIRRPLVVQFNRSMDTPSLNRTTVVLYGPNGPAAMRPMPVENGRLLFVTPDEDLAPGANYTLFVNGARDTQGRTLPLTAVGFVTQTIGSDGGAAIAASPAQASTARGGVQTRLSDQRGGDQEASSSTPAQQGVVRRDQAVAASSSKNSENRDVASAAGSESDRWIPSAKNRRGDWRSGRKHFAATVRPKNERLHRALHGHPEIKARMGTFTPGAVSRDTLARLVPARFRTPEAGPTAILGQVSRLNGQPLPGVRVSIGARTALTDAEGEFALENAPSGHQVLVIDGSSGRYTRRPFGRYEYGVNVVANQRNVLPFKIWLTELDVENAVNVPSPTTTPTVLTNPNIPGLELRIPAGTVIRDADGRVVTKISMTPIPIDQAPFPLPNFQVPVYFTVQPGGARLERGAGGVHPGAQLIYPNFTRSRPGTRMLFWNYDPIRGWHEYGRGTVSADRQRIIPDDGVVIHQFSGAMVSLPENAPPEGPKECKRGDPVDCYTGLFINEGIDLTVPDIIPLEVRRTYRNRDDASRSFGIGTNLSYDFFIVGTSHGTASSNGTYTYQDLILPDGEHIYYPRISPGTDFVDAVYQNTSAPGKFYGSIIQWEPVWWRWMLTLRDGTKFYFIDSDSSTSARMAAVAEIEDRNGNKLTITRDENYNLTRITSPSGRHIEFDYDLDNRIVAAHDDAGRTIQYEYDVDGRLIEVTDQNSNTEEFTYDASNNMLTVTDKRGNTKVTNTFDTNDRVATQEYADSSTTSFDYTLDTNGAVTQTDITDQRGVVTRMVFNANGYPTAVTLALGLSEEKTWTINRNGTTNLISSVVDPLGRTTSYTFDAIGNVTELTKLAGTANALTTAIEYSALSRPTEVTVGGRTTVFNYSSAGDLEEIIDPLGHSRTFTYDSRGRVLTEANGNDVTIATYSYLGGGAVSATDALGRTSTVEMDSPSSVLRINPMGARTSLSYNGLGKLAAVVDPNGGDIQFEYDANGNMLEHEDASENSTSFAYDVMNRLSSKTDAYSNAENYLYDAAGSLTRRTDRKGQVSGITYDNLGRPTVMGYGATISNPTTYSRTVTNTWDAGNRLIQMSDSLSGTITRTFDDFDRLLSESTPQGVVSYTYDAAGRRASMTVQGQPTVTYQWDDADRLVSIQQAAGASNGFVAQTIAFEYDDANRLTKTTLANGIEAAYVYDDADRVTEINITRSNSQAIGNLTYTYDSAGKRTSVGGSLANVDLPAAIGSALYGDNNELVEWDSVALSYDDNGNLLSDGSRTYTWDSKDQLASISGSASGAFEYDAVGRRIGRTINSSSLGYVYDGSNIVQEKTGTSSQATVIANLLVGAVDRVYARMQNADVSSMLMDAQGSVLAEADDSETLTASYAYGPYGDTSASGTSTGNTQQYVSRENDGTGLYYYRARYYSPQTARFIGEDPIGWASGQPNNYAYVGGDPISRVDPLGLWSFTLEFYRGFGGSFTVGQSPTTGDWFAGYRIGAGIGAGFAWDPLDEDPAQEAAMANGHCSSSGVSAGFFGAVGGNAGPVSAGFEAQAGAYSASSSGFYGDIGPEASVGTSWGVRGSAAAGFENSFWTCTCAK